MFYTIKFLNTTHIYVIEFCYSLSLSDPALPTQDTILPEPGKPTTDEGAVIPPKSPFELPYPL